MDGWKLVPVEPTNKMAIAGAAIWGFDHEKAVPVYKAMLAAAPEPPADERDAEIARLREALVRAEGRFRKVAKRSNAPLSIGLFAAAEDCAAALRGEPDR
jgi:hypothetical protein